MLVELWGGLPTGDLTASSSKGLAPRRHGAGHLWCHGPTPAQLREARPVPSKSWAAHFLFHWGDFRKFCNTTTTFVHFSVSWPSGHFRHILPSGGVRMVIFELDMLSTICWFGCSARKARCCRFSTVGPQINQDSALRAEIQTLSALRAELLVDFGLVGPPLLGPLFQEPDHVIRVGALRDSIEGRHPDNLRPRVIRYRPPLRACFGECVSEEAKNITMKRLLGASTSYRCFGCSCQECGALRACSSPA